ncbi:MAG: rhomboid family intramembrane serine protease [Pararhodobacter sp.]|nr:rhomboid family intramembrane serine protease [Pararhodobacter sp.]
MLVIADNNPVKHIRRAYVNYALILLCVVLFFLDPPYQHYGFTPANLHLVGGPKAQTSWDMIALQSVSYIFLHADILHLAGNMIALWVFGNNIEDSMGHARYPLFFVLCGVAGAVCEGVMSATPMVPVVGASGAIAGVMGAYLLLHPRARVLVLVAFRIPVLVPASVFVGLTIALDVFSALLPNPDSEMLIAWWAHIGGFAAGMVLILAMRHRDVALFQPAAIYPENGFGRFRWLMINLAPRPGSDTQTASRWRQGWFAFKTVAFFVTIVVIVEAFFA